MVSGRGLARDYVGGMKRGAKACIIKSCRPAHLVGTIRTAVAR